ncbi:amino acid permease [Anaerovorax odorimutans]|uniref:amino acid permease n=1 Tax=Anaerovorax odorimutans TaxID=109327 RepID=UPI0003F639D0|nr:amino acid permease [Anaerovorax odorimutans]
MSNENKPVEAECQELKRGIKGWQVAFIGLGGVIGSCYFLGVGVLVRDMGPAVLLAFAVVGLIVYGLMIAYAELLVNLPRKGSFVAYTNEFLGETLSVGMGWSFWFNWVCYVPSEAIAVSIVLNVLIPGNTMAYAIGALAVLTIINLTAVDIFAKIESTLAIIKVCAIISFIIAAFGIWVGLWGNEGFLGASINFGNDALSFGQQLFPNGFTIVLVNMVIVLVTFQGTEIVGLAAAEAQDPDKSVPKACKSVTYRIVVLYLIPILLILLIFPYGEANIDGSIFSDTLAKYNLNFLAGLMSSVVLIAAFSCANTGFYGTVRCMFGLSVEGLAPKFLSKLNKSSNPKNAVIFTLVFMWIVLMIGLLASESSIYENLLSMSGFTGTLAWVGIIASQLVFRKRIKARGYDTKDLKARVKPGQTWIPPVAMIAQLFCLVLLAFGEGQLPVFILACSAVVLPMIVRFIAKKTGHVRPLNALGNDEKTFDETFPPLK